MITRKSFIQSGVAQVVAPSFPECFLIRVRRRLYSVRNAGVGPGHLIPVLPKQVWTSRNKQLQIRVVSLRREAAASRQQSGTPPGTQLPVFTPGVRHPADSRLLLPVLVPRPSTRRCGCGDGAGMLTVVAFDIVASVSSEGMSSGLLVAGLWPPGGALPGLKLVLS